MSAQAIQDKYSKVLAELSYAGSLYNDPNVKYNGTDKLWGQHIEEVYKGKTLKEVFYQTDSNGNIVTDSSGTPQLNQEIFIANDPQNDALQSRLINNPEYFAETMDKYHFAGSTSTIRGDNGKYVEYQKAQTLVVADENSSTFIPKGTNFTNSQGTNDIGTDLEIPFIITQYQTENASFAKEFINQEDPKNRKNENPILDSEQISNFNVVDHSLGENGGDAIAVTLIEANHNVMRSVSYEGAASKAEFERFSVQQFEDGIKRGTGWVAA